MGRTLPLTNNISDFLLMVLKSVRAIFEWWNRPISFTYLDLVALLLLIVNGVDGLFHLAEHQVAVTVVGLYRIISATNSELISVLWILAAHEACP